MCDDKEVVEFDAFQEQAWARAGGHARREDHEALMALALALCEEAGEVGAVLTKARRRGVPFDRGRFVEELGDALWTIAMCARSAGVSLSVVASVQIAKNRALPRGIHARGRGGAHRRGDAMRTYRVSGTMTISVMTDVEATSKAHARRLADEREPMTLCHQCADGPIDQAWVTSGELDGAVEITTVAASDG